MLEILRCEYIYDIIHVTSYLCMLRVMQDSAKSTWNITTGYVQRYEQCREYYGVSIDMTSYTWRHICTCPVHICTCYVLCKTLRTVLRILLRAMQDAMNNAGNIMAQVSIWRHTRDVISVHAWCISVHATCYARHYEQYLEYCYGLCTTLWTILTILWREYRYDIIHVTSHLYMHGSSFLLSV